VHVLVGVYFSVCFSACVCFYSDTQVRILMCGQNDAFNDNGQSLPTASFTQILDVYETAQFLKENKVGA